ncbi:DNA-processing protein DprA [Nocardia sp. NPDC052566]|uniref:DNA-processing protein DprA n=1 Tax=Nocardia sp. NPDC052566 TaxID=3364330 RepID=UPI0037C6A869
MSDARQLMWAILARAALTAPEDIPSLIAQVGPDEAADMLTTGATTIQVPGDIGDAARADLDRAAAIDARLITPDGSEWPARLADLDAESARSVAPVALWARGPARLDMLSLNAIGIVGARACTEYGRTVTTEIATDFATRGWTVVSGGAFGVDAAAHSAALDSSAATIAVLATGVDRSYPHAHTQLFRDIAATGLLVSEYPPRTSAMHSLFLGRNRLVAALTRGLVVTESGLRGGTRHTARWANQLNRPVFAVPGSVFSAASAGCHAMIRAGQAELVTAASHILDALAPTAEHPPAVRPIGRPSL